MASTGQQVRADQQASVVGKLAEILRTPFDGDLLDALTTFERKIMIHEARSRETIIDSLKIGCVIAGMGQNSMQEHLLMSAANSPAGRILFERLSRSSTQEKPSLHPHQWILMHSKETVTSAGSTDTPKKNVGVRTTEGQRTPNVRSVERNIMDSVGYGVTHHPVEGHSKEDGKETEKETAREPRKVESSEVEKAATTGKEKAKERKDNVSTKSQNHQRNSGQVDLGNNGLNNLGAQKPTLRVGVTMIGVQQIRTLRPQQQPKNFRMRLSVRIFST